MNRHPERITATNQAVANKYGAGEGNRTLVCSLGSCRSTIELHPRILYQYINVLEKVGHRPF